MDDRQFHLQMIQGVITRMGGNSFWLKGWCVTLVSAIIALAARDSGQAFVNLAIVPILIFWILDAYYLSQERLFRKLYDHVRQTDPDKIDFSMNTQPFQADDTRWFSVAFSKTILLFYGLLFLVAILIARRLVGA